MKYRLSALLMAGALALTMPVCADITIDSVEVDSQASTVKVSGKADENNADILITASSKKAANSEFFDKLGYQDMIKSGENGSFEITFKMTEADLYTLTAATKKENDKLDFTFTSKDALETSVGVINDSTTLADDLEENKFELGLYVEGIEDEPDWDSFADRVEKLVPIGTEDANNTILSLQRELILQYIEEEKVENIFKVNKYLDIFSGENNDVFEKILSEENEVYATSLISGEEIADYDEFIDKITEAMIIAVVKDPDGFGNLKDVLVAHEDLIDIDTDGVEDQVYKDLCGKKVDSLEDLKDEFEELTEDDDDDSSSGGGKTSGGGGGSLSGGKISYASTPADSIQTPADNSMFTDLGNYAWAKESIEKLANRGIVSGRGAGQFAPADNVTRSEFVKMIVLALDIKAEDKEISFEDVLKTGWDYEYVKAAYSAGIITGVSESYFGGNEKISRQDMAVIISRALKVAGRNLVGASNDKFADDSYISDYSREAVYALRQAGIMQGDDLGRFNPINPANRAEAAKVICSVLN